LGENSDFPHRVSRFIRFGWHDWNGLGLPYPPVPRDSKVQWNWDFRCLPLYRRGLDLDLDLDLDSGAAALVVASSLYDARQIYVPALVADAGTSDTVFVFAGSMVLLLLVGFGVGLSLCRSWTVRGGRQRDSEMLFLEI
jgi:hypothetical protein